ncbi:MAG: hypothetical protein ACP5I1_18720, partial [Candidatus Hinthialibacter sp.]
MNNPLDIITPDISELQTISSPIRVIGIDLGTTNSTVAEICWNPEQDAINPRCLEVEQETLAGPYMHILVPSVVAITGNAAWVGEG